MEESFMPPEESEDIGHSMPVKSKEKYKKEFLEFEKWKEEKNITSNSESVLIEYFTGETNERYAPSSLFTKYSMLKSTLKTYKNVDISNYTELLHILKKKCRSYKPKKCKILEQAHIETFLKEAPDEKYLMSKVAIIFGIAGACKRDELTYLKIEDVEDKGSYFYISVHDAKRNSPRSFAIMEESFCINAVEMCRKYILLRPARCSSNGRFFLQYIDGKCNISPVGKNSISRIPASIAAYLKLPDPGLYSGHNIRNPRVDQTVFKHLQHFGEPTLSTPSPLDDSESTEINPLTDAEDEISMDYTEMVKTENITELFENDFQGNQTDLAKKVKFTEINGEQSIAKSSENQLSIDECDNFGLFVAHEMKALHNEFLQRKLKRGIQRLILEISEENENMLHSPHLNSLQNSSNYFNSSTNSRYTFMNEQSDNL